MSKLYNTRDLIEKNMNAVQKVSQKAEKMGFGRQVVSGIVKTADKLSLGATRAIRETLIQSNIGRKTMSSLDIEKAKMKWFGAYSYQDNEYYLIPYKVKYSDIFCFEIFLMNFCDKVLIKLVINY